MGANSRQALIRAFTVIESKSMKIVSTHDLVGAKTIGCLVQEVWLKTGVPTIAIFVLKLILFRHENNEICM